MIMTGLCQLQEAFDILGLLVNGDPGCRRLINIRLSPVIAVTPIVSQQKVSREHLVSDSFVFSVLLAILNSDGYSRYWAYDPQTRMAAMLVVVGIA